jgi:hypothetical protein
MIAMQEDPTDLLETLANAFVPAAKTPPRARNGLGRDPEDSLLEPGQGSSHVATRIRHHLRRIAPDNAENGTRPPS